LVVRAGFRVVKRRVFEANTIYDTEDLSLRSTKRLLRVRSAGRHYTLTFKGAPAVSRHKVREELETPVEDATAMARILEALGYAPKFRYEKYRTEYRRGREDGLVLLDETPIGVFIELEGPPAWIDRTAAQLGLAESDYLTQSYGSLYLEHCAARGITPGHMVFPT
jgi:adenylate cyclase class 2